MKMKTKLSLLAAVLACLTVAPASAQSVRLDIAFTDPVINFGPLSFGLAELPSEVNAVFLLEGGRTSSSGTTTYVASDALAASVPFGDAGYTVTRSLLLEVQPDLTIGSLRWEFEPITTPSVSNGVIIMNSPLFVTGTDTASGESFSYTYATSVETISVVPEPATWILLSGLGLAGVVRRRR